MQLDNPFTINSLPAAAVDGPGQFTTLHKIQQQRVRLKWI